MAVKIILKNSATEDKRPTPGQLENGEIALNYNEAGAFLTCKDTDGNIQQVGGVKIAETAPDGPVKQTLWFQPSSLTLFVYDGDSFLPIASGGGGGTPGGGITTIIGDEGIEATTVGGNTVNIDVDLHGGDDGLEFRDSKLKASVASASQLGSVKIGDGIDVDSTGTISVDIPQALNFKGPANLNNPPTGQINPNPPEVGDTYVNSALANPVDNGWTGIGGEVSQAGDLVVWDGSEWEIIGTGGTPDVDLGYAAAPNNGTVTNTAGNDAVIPIADDTNAGLFTAAEKTKLEGIDDDINDRLTEVNLSYAPNGDSDGTVENDAGNDATIPVAIASDSSVTPATAGVAGLFTGAEKEKLAGIEDGATNEGTNDGRYLRKDAAAGDQTVESTGTTTFKGLTSHGGGVKVTGGFTEGSITSGVFSDIANATDTYNFYAAGTAPNYFGGDIQGLNYVNRLPVQPSNFQVCVALVPDHNNQNVTNTIGANANAPKNTTGQQVSAVGYQVDSRFSADFVNDNGGIERTARGFQANLDKAVNGRTWAFYGNGDAPSYFKGNVTGGGSDGENFNWIIRTDGSTSPFNIELQMQSDEPTAFQTTYSADEEGNQVENTRYIGESESLLAIIKDLRARVEALEAAATS